MLKITIKGSCIARKIGACFNHRDRSKHIRSQWFQESAPGMKEAVRKYWQDLLFVFHPSKNLYIKKRLPRKKTTAAY